MKFLIGISVLGTVVIYFLFSCKIRLEENAVKAGSQIALTCAGPTSAGGMQRIWSASSDASSRENCPDRVVSKLEPSIHGHASAILISRLRSKKDGWLCIYSAFQLAGFDDWAKKNVDPLGVGMVTDDLSQSQIAQLAKISTVAIACKVTQ